MSLQALNIDCKKIISSINHYSNDELDELMSNESKIENLIVELDHSYLKNLESEKETLLTSIQQLSEANIAREPELVEGRERIAELSGQGEELSKVVEEKYLELRDKGGDMSLETALALLQTAASEIEEESDNIAKSFLDNEKELDSFLDEFLVKRKIMHLRMVKAEKMTKLVSQEAAFGGGNYINAPPLSINTSYFPNVPPVNPASVPYPTGPLNMPMPGMNFFQNHY